MARINDLSAAVTNDQTIKSKIQMKDQISNLRGKPQERQKKYLEITTDSSSASSKKEGPAHKRKGRNLSGLSGKKLMSLG